jgi:hypothetical protein
MGTLAQWVAKPTLRRDTFISFGVCWESAVLGLTATTGGGTTKAAREESKTARLGSCQGK